MAPMRRAASAPRLIGYARVSNENQATDPHILALRAAGCSTISQDRLQVREPDADADRREPKLGLEDANGSPRGTARRYLSVSA